jgi:hypothetical protein
MATMNGLLKRPVPSYDPARPLLANEHFQICYITNDVDRAVALFAERYGIPHFRASDVELPSGAWIRLRVAWIGGVAYEIVCGGGPGMEHFTCEPLSSGFVLRHHHFCYLVPDEESWSALERAIEQGGWKVRQNNRHDRIGRTMMIEAPELGHFLEYVMPGPDIVARYEATPSW